MATSTKGKHHTLEVPGSGRAWLIAWFVLNCSVTIVNKLILTDWNFTFPVSLSAVHMATSAVLSYISIWVYRFPTKYLDQRQMAFLVGFSLLFALNIMIGNLCLKYVSVSLLQIVRSIIPGITLGLSILMLKKRYPPRYYGSVLLVIIGVFLATVGEFEAKSVTTFGLALTFFVCFLSAFKSVVSAKFLVGSMQFHPVDLLARMSAISCVQMLIVGYLLGEFHEIADWWSAFPTHRSDLGWMLLALLINGIMAFALNFSNFITTKKTSPLTVTVSGNVKHVAIIILAFYIFRTPVSLLNALGTVTTIAGAGFYSYHEYNDQTAKTSRKSDLELGLPVRTHPITPYDHALPVVLPGAEQDDVSKVS